MKKMSKLLALLLAVLMVAAVAVACTESSDNGKETGNQTTASPDGDASSSATEGPDVPDVNMEGFVLSILNYAEGAGYSKATLDIEYSEDIDSVDEEIYHRNRRVETKYNCEINVTGVPLPHETLNSVVSAGDSSFDMSMCYEEFVNLVLENIMDWQLLPYVDLQAEWWNQGANDTFNLSGVQFAATGDFSLSHYNKIYTFIYNKDLYDDIDTGYDLYEEVRNGSWTIDRMYEIAKPFNQNLDGDDNVVSSEDGHGIVATSKIIFSLLLTGAGAKIVDLDEDHEPFFALMNQKYLDILDKIIAINAGPDGYYRNAPSHNDALYMTEYASGNTLFYATILSGVNSTRDYNFSTGYLPAPKYNEDQKEYYSISIGGNISVLPRNLQADRMDYVGILLEVLSYESRNTSVAEYRDTYLKTKLADENDAEMIQLLFDTVTYDLGNNLFAKKGRLEVNKNIFHELNRQYTSALEVIETDVENQIEEYLELIAKIIDAQ